MFPYSMYDADSRQILSFQVPRCYLYLNPVYDVLRYQ